MLNGHGCSVYQKMPALISGKIPSPLVSAIGLFRYPRKGLTDPAEMPRIERSLTSAKIDMAWLVAYRDCVGLPSGKHTLPPLALQIAAAPLHLAILADKQFPFRALGLVHMSQHIKQTQAVSPNASIDLVAFTTDVQWERRGMSFGLVTQAYIAGQMVWEGVTRALATGESPLSAGTVKLRSESTDRLAPPEVTKFIDVPENCGRRYAKIAGDRNPIHQHALLARPFGLRRAIVHGTWTLARALALADLPANDRFTFNATFLRPVELPSRILIKAYRAAGDSPTCVFVQNDTGTVNHLNVIFEG
jgi:acyl dehydratase